MNCFDLTCVVAEYDHMDHSKSGQKQVDAIFRLDTMLIRRSNGLVVFLLDLISGVRER